MHKQPFTLTITPTVSLQSPINLALFNHFKQHCHLLSLIIYEKQSIFPISGKNKRCPKLVCHVLHSVCTVFTCRKMNYPDSAVCGVDMLTSSSTRPLSVYPEILWVDCERDLTRTHTNTTNYTYYIYLDKQQLNRTKHSGNFVSLLRIHLSKLSCFNSILVIWIHPSIVCSCTSVGWGSTATVMVLVCIRPCFSVLGTLWTRWTPASNFILL